MGDDNNRKKNLWEDSKRVRLRKSTVRGASDGEDIEISTYMQSFKKLHNKRQAKMEILIYTEYPWYK